jgi:hypothetical protein
MSPKCAEKADMAAIGLSDYALIRQCIHKNAIMQMHKGAVKLFFTTWANAR